MSTDGQVPSEPGGDEPSPVRRATGWRLWLFRVAAAILAPLGLLVLLEIGLHICGCGFPATATIACRTGGVLCRGDNVKFGWRFFPRNIAQEFDPFLFPAVKPPGTCRIVVLGESAAQGTPDPAYSFGRILEVMLRHAYPGRDFEVIVAAMPAINSHAVVEIARDMARYRPDFFVAYVGNNEVIGPYGPGTVFSPLSPHRWSIRAGICLRGTRTGQLLADVASCLGVHAQTPKVWRGLEMFDGRCVAADDPRLETVYRHFRRNLGDLRCIAANSGAEILFCTLGSNLRDCPPFASLHRAGLSAADLARWTGLYENAVRREAEGDHAAAAAGYLAAAGIDDSYAELQFRLGRCYWLAVDPEKACERFMLARDLDALRLRPDRHINKIIRDVVALAHDGRVHLVDAEEAFRDNSPSGAPGHDLFHEHVHLTFPGNYVLARAIYERLAGRTPLPEQSRHSSGPAVLSEAGCAERLGYNAWAHYNILFKVLHYYVAKPPFTKQLGHSERMQQLERELQEAQEKLTAAMRGRIAAQYRDLVANSPGDIWLRLRFAEFASTRLQDEHVAVEQCRRVQELLPHSYKPHLLLGLSLGELKRFAEAGDHLQEAAQIKPTCGQAWHLLGLARRAQGRLQEALTGFQRAVALQPDDVEAYQQAAELLVTLGKPLQAERLLRKGLSAVPDDRRLHESLSTVLRRQGRDPGADGESRAL